ncbi:Retron-type RNA-directed DNA polymerase [Microcystis panniformis FACHB-1757]|uniref:Retron-type RNA-directed DNA polymerase n=1 Tax=Microcystis panniformis FACHB-1757 TaxID=1638788 RepID=A0A0K1RW50_9CHRO|nr:Retron-type RNA-directed DNA polymerase [Microcystis panniformis FACHB-1757]
MRTGNAINTFFSFSFWLFGLCYAMDGGYKGWNPYIERDLAIFVNCFLSRAN